MIKDFKCSNCGHVFTADDRNEVCCPKCKSDNIDYVKKSYIQYIVLPGIFILAAIIGYLLVQLIPSKTEEDPDQDEIETDTVSSVVEPISIPEDLPISVQINFTTPVFDKKTQKYSFTASLNVDNKAGKMDKDVKYHFALLDAFDSKKIIAESKDGLFNNVSYSNDGTYKLTVVGENRELKCEERTIAGFIQQKEVSVAEKLSKESLQSMINKSDPILLGKHQGIAPGCKVACTNLRDGDAKISRISEVYEKLVFEWESVTVSSVLYDELNRVNSITIQAKYQ